MTDEPKKTENETANNVVDIKMERSDKVYIEARLLFNKGTKLVKIINDTKKFIDKVKDAKPSGDGFT